MDDILSCVHTLNSLGAKGHAAIELIKRYTKNILDNPTAAKYRRIRIENAKFNAVIWSLEAGRNLVYALGFEQEGSDYLILPEDIDISFLRDAFIEPSTTSTPTTQEVTPAAPSLRLGRSTIGYDQEVGQRALIATGNKGVQPAMDWITANPQSCVLPKPTATSDSEDVSVKSKPSILPPVSRYESTNADRHAFQEKKRKEEILAAKIAKKEHLAAKKMLLASVEAEKKLRQPGAAFAADQRTEQIQSKADHPTSPRQHSEVAMIKLRMPNGKVCTLQLNPNDTVETLYQRASQAVGSSSSDIKLLSPSTLQIFADKDINLEDAGLTPRGLIIVQLLHQGDEDPR